MLFCLGLYRNNQVSSIVRHLSNMPASFLSKCWIMAIKATTFACMLLVNIAAFRDTFCWKFCFISRTLNRVNALSWHVQDCCYAFTCYSPVFQKLFHALCPHFFFSIDQCHRYSRSPGRSSSLMLKCPVRNRFSYHFTVILLCCWDNIIISFGVFSCARREIITTRHPFCVKFIVTDDLFTSTPQNLKKKLKWWNLAHNNLE